MLMLLDNESVLLQTFQLGIKNILTLFQSVIFCSFYLKILLFSCTLFSKDLFWFNNVECQNIVF